MSTQGDFRNNTLYYKIQSQKARCFKEMIGPEAEPLYDVLAELVSDKRCKEIDQITSEETMRFRSFKIGKPKEKCKIKLSTISRIAAGDLSFKVSGSKEVKLTWNSNYNLLGYSGLSVNGWLNGQRDKEGRPTGMHQGLYKQKNIELICDIDSKGSKNKTVVAPASNCYCVGEPRVIRVDAILTKRTGKYYLFKSDIKCDLNDAKIGAVAGDIYEMMCMTNDTSCPADLYKCAEDTSVYDEQKILQSKETSYRQKAKKYKK